jgi:hypothetical protein
MATGPRSSDDAGIKIVTRVDDLSRFRVIVQAIPVLPA